MNTLIRSVVLALLLVPAGCGQPGPVEPGTWRCVLALPGGDLPFLMQMEQSASGWSATLVNGVERVSVADVTVSPERLVLVLPAFNTRIDASREGTGYRGELTLVKRGGKKQVIPFHAMPGHSYRFFDRPADRHATVDGRWQVTFSDDDGGTSEAVAEFAQSGHRVQGTFLTPTGDYRFLDGEVVDDQLHLSTFDGSHAFLFTATLVGDELRGEFWSGTAWHESWTARRNESAKLPDPDSLTRLVGQRFSFEFPDTSGQRVSLDDARFDGKVVLVAMAGSWCPNCHDEAAFLAPLYELYRDRGLEIVGLMFEHLEDFDAAAQQVDAFRNKFDIKYPLLVAGSSDKKLAAETMSMLDRVYAYPTSIFIDRNGEVRRIHTGFNGPGTGEHYAALVAGFKQTIEELLMERDRAIF